MLLSPGSAPSCSGRASSTHPPTCKDDTGKTDHKGEDRRWTGPAFYRLIFSCQIIHPYRTEVLTGQRLASQHSVKSGKRILSVRRHATHVARRRCSEEGVPYCVLPR